MVMKLRGGVLIIGSLYWQNDLKPGDKKRQEWRCNRLDMASSVNVKVPIRYGRSSKKGGEIYTMIFDNKLPPQDYGVAKFVPFQNQTEVNIYEEATELSKSEGVGQDYIKGTKGDSVAWCVCTIAFNPKVEKKLKSNILKKWESELQNNEIGYGRFLTDSNIYSSIKSGELAISWPKNLRNYDFLIATSTRPDPRSIIPESEIAELVYNRPYFHPNIQFGITTCQDNKIFDRQKKSVSQCKNDFEKLIFLAPKIRVGFDQKWAENFPNEPGIYAVFDKEKTIYFGETGNIRKRMRDLRRTVNHSLRRTLGFELFGEKATTKIKFSDRVEIKLNEYFEKNISVACVVQKFGRLEIEEFLVDKYKEQLYNKKSKRM